MDIQVKEMAGARVMICAAEGPPLDSEQAFLDLLGETWGHEIDWIAVPVARLGPDFLRLRTGLAGAILQKAVNYGMGLAIVGDISGAVAASAPLADFVRESNEGRHVRFTPDLETLEASIPSTGPA